MQQSRQQIMATATSPRREINTRVRPAGSLETDGFTVKSLLKNAKVLKSKFVNRNLHVFI